MNYKKKIQEIQTKINIINKYYINQVTNPSKEKHVYQSYYSQSYF